MAGLYIPNARLPKDGPIAIVLHPDSTADVYTIFAGVLDKQIWSRKVSAVPDHGALIDRDAMLEAMPAMFAVPSKTAHAIEKTIIEEDRSEQD